MFGRWEFSHKIILSFRDQSADWSWESVSPGGRPTRSFIRAGAAAGLLLSQFPVSAGVKLQLLHTTKEVQKPSVSAGVLWVLSFAIERKLPAGGIKRKDLWKNSPPPARRVTSPKRILPNIICIFHRQVLTNLPDFSNMIEKTGRILEETVWNCIRLWPEIFTASASPSD